MTINYTRNYIYYPFYFSQFPNLMPSDLSNSVYDPFNKLYNIIKNSIEIISLKKSPGMLCQWSGVRSVIDKSPLKMDRCLMLQPFEQAIANSLVRKIKDDMILWNPKKADVVRQDYRFYKGYEHTNYLKKNSGIEVHDGEQPNLTVLLFEQELAGFVQKCEFVQGLREFWRYLEQLV
jgi:hypothetical protein